MSKNSERDRKLAVKRFQIGERPSAMCASIGKSRFWLYKWIKRFNPKDLSWCESRSKRPINSPQRIPVEIEEIIKMVRLNLYNNDLFCGEEAICW